MMGKVQYIRQVLSQILTKVVEGEIFHFFFEIHPKNFYFRDGKDTYYSEILYGHLTFNENDESAKISFESSPVSVKSGYSLSGRGMELSDLIVFDGNILTVDDRTGIVFKVVGKDIVPWNILSDGDGLSTKGFKGEWMTVKGKGDKYMDHIMLYRSGSAWKL